MESASLFMFTNKPVNNDNDNYLCRQHIIILLYICKAGVLFSCCSYVIPLFYTSPAVSTQRNIQKKTDNREIITLNHYVQLCMYNIHMLCAMYCCSNNINSSMIFIPLTFTLCNIHIQCVCMLQSVKYSHINILELLIKSSYALHKLYVF